MSFEPREYPCEKHKFMKTISNHLQSSRVANRPSGGLSLAAALFACCREMIRQGRRNGAFKD
jgi:hypothetical protein